MQHRDPWNDAKDGEPYGAATIGSSEACMLGGLAHKWNWREARHKAGKDASRAKHGNWRQRPDRLEKVLALFRCRAADCAPQLHLRIGLSAGEPVEDDNQASGTHLTRRRN